MRAQNVIVRYVAAAAVLSGWVVAASDVGPAVEGEGTNTADAVVSPASVPADTNAPPPAAVQAPKPNLSPELAEVIRLAESGLSDDVILAYIQRSPPASAVSADQIVYLRDLGISSPVLQALVERSAPAQGQSATPAAPPAMSPAPPAPTPESPAPPPPATASTAPPAPDTADYTDYSDALAPYGTWMLVPGYGWCWQPTVVVVNPYWQPYCQDGCWMWTDCGWYWNSYYSWGWAPFHYGRWCRYPAYGWIWCPDRVWGPAWVCWRQAPGYCGWAPLPPGAHLTAGIGWTYHGQAVSANYGFGLAASSFTFVSYSHFTDRHPFDSRLSASYASAVYNQTTVNNNFVVPQNGRVSNRGIDVQRVEAATRKPLRQVSVRDLEATRRAFSTPAGTSPGSYARTPNVSPGFQQNGPMWNTAPAKPSLTAPVRNELRPITPSAPVYTAPKYEPMAPRAGYSTSGRSQSHP